MTSATSATPARPAAPRAPGAPRRLRRAAVLAAPLLALAGVPALATAPATAVAGPTFVVTSAADAGDARADGTCRTAGGDCTLRAALTEAARASGHVTVRFDVPGGAPATISPASLLPALSNPAGTTLDGFSQPGASRNTAASGSRARLGVQLKGQGSNRFDGITITSPGNEVSGFAVYDFAKHIALAGDRADRNVVVGNNICTNAAGTFRVREIDPRSMGVTLTDGPSGNRIGRPGAGNRNVVSGCGHRGVTMTSVGTRDNLVQNNLIGLNPTGTAKLPNQQHGVDINFTAYNTIGGARPGEGNVVSGNAGSGIEVSHTKGTHHNQVVGNSFGTDASGTRAPSYARNAYWAVRLEGPKTCGPCPDDAGENTVRGNTIVNSGNGGILIDKGQHDNVVRDNRIGVLPSGAAAGNVVYGIRIGQGARRNTIGPGNTIAENGTGVQVQPGATEPVASTRADTGQNTLTRNVIRDNRRLGIDLFPYGPGGVAADPLANDGVAVPVLAAASSSAVSGRACARCRVEVYAADTASASAYGEGRRLVGAGVAAADGSFRVALSSAPGAAVSATATTPGGSTSEFARNRAVR